MHEQYPIEITDRRRQLVPIMKDARGKGHEAVLKEDRLYIDKRRFYPRPFVSSFNHPPPPPPPPPAAVPMNVQPPVTRGYDRCTRGQCYTTENNNSDNFVNRKHEHFFKIYYLNICGLKSKLKFHEITDIIVSHHIIIFVETKLDDLDILNVPNGYSYITKK